MSIFQLIVLFLFSNYHIFTQMQHKAPQKLTLGHSTSNPRLYDSY